MLYMMPEMLAVELRSCTSKYNLSCTFLQFCFMNTLCHLWCCTWCQRCWQWSGDHVPARTTFHVPFFNSVLRIPCAVCDVVHDARDVGGGVEIMYQQVYQTCRSWKRRKNPKKILVILVWWCLLPFDWTESRLGSFLNSWSIGLVQSVIVKWSALFHVYINAKTAKCLHGYGREWRNQEKTKLKTMCACP